MANVDLSNLIKEDRDSRKGKSFEGSFLDYLEVVKRVRILQCWLIKECSS